MTLVGVRTVVSGVLVQKGRTLAAPPNAPGTLTATAEDSQVALSWVASTTPGVTYQIKRVNLNTVAATASGTSTTVTGLTNGVTYNFQVYAVNGVGISGPSNIATAVPAKAGTTEVATYFGFNSATNTSAGDRSIDSMTGKKGQFSGRAPVVRVYIPAATGLTPNFTPTTATCPEKRVVISFKAGGNWTEAELASGAAIADMVSFLEDIPAGWVVFWVYHHEPNSSGGMEVNPTNFVNTYKYMMQAKNSATLAAGVKVYITACFMDYQTAGGMNYPVKTSTWDDAWVPPKGTHCDILAMDAYGNPGQNTSPSGSNAYGGPATGTMYDTTYPVPSIRYSNMFDLIERNGYADSWGILEVNTPLRNWDTNEVGRKKWHTDTLALFLAGGGMTGGTPPKVCLLWEGVSGANWNQGFGQNTHAAKNGHYSPYTDGTGSPLWSVWAPYMTAMPLTG